MSVNFVYNSKTIKFPTNWNDLTPKHYPLAAAYFKKYMGAKKGDVVVQTEKYKDQLGLIKEFTQMKMIDFMYITAAQFADIVPLLDFLETDKDVDLDKNLLPEFKIGRKTFYGPESGLRHSSFAEFMYADTYFMSYFQNFDEEYLWKLCAVLYRPGIKNSERKSNTWNGDHRISFNENRTAEYENLFRKKLSKTNVFGVFLFYWGFRNVHLMRFEKIFPKPKEKTQPEESANPEVKPQVTIPNWSSVLVELSGSKHGTLNETAKTNWFTILTDFQMQIEKAEQIEKQSKK